ncbi:helix-turn-helix domain-containing protein [Tindallia californiensis]|uniref:GGDEF domain-containing protein n=1 Tax=Tindallia californiensis TaxID=159292 RepID=A0A1H3P7R7_9FIRM|nr:hypothetical protein [Tindallia californiensis]SDY97146.1 hypothetical protein SAMN05192546_10656 [Tindallia californiensis]
MKFTIGLIGAEDSVTIMDKVSKEYEKEAVFIPLPYRCKEDAICLAEQHIDKMDAVIFSGHVPYYIVMKKMKMEIPSLYLPHSGTSIYQALLKMKNSGRNIEKVSFDNVSTTEMNEIYEDLEMSSKNVFIKEYEQNLKYQEWADYHTNLFRNEKTEAAVTCLKETSKILQREGIPVYRVLVTRPLIRQVIESALYEVKARKLRHNQIAVLVVNIDEFKKEIKKFPSEYGVQKLKLDFHRILLDYAEETKGRIFSMGNDEYLIFTTGGSLENSSKNHGEITLLDIIRKKLKMRASVGIGFDTTAYDAEHNARIGLEHAKKYGGDCLFIVDQNHRIKGPLGKEHQLEYRLASLEEKIISVAEKTKLSVKSVNRIVAMMDKHGCKVTAKEFAHYLRMTERSARRILGALEEKGYSKIVGEESEGKGRPRKIYELQL